MTGVVFDGRRIRHTMGDGRVQEMAWADLTEVRIITNGKGPFEEDVFFVLSSAGKECVLPHSELGRAFVTRLQRLPDFDSHALIAAMGSTTDNEFLCWRLADAV